MQDFMVRSESVLRPERDRTELAHLTPRGSMRTWFSHFEETHMLDYIGGHITQIERTRSGHKITLRHPCTDEGEPVDQQFHIRGPAPGETGERMVVMLLEDEVAGWHNQATGAQGHLLHALPRLRWHIRDAVISLSTASVGNLAGNWILGAAGGLGWLLSTLLWRFYTIRHARGELTEALQLAAGVTATRK